jgi:hypothetical protein
MRSDYLFDKKCVHFKLDKDVHFALRAKLFKYDVSMQELFDEFARQVAADAPKAISILESLVAAKLKYSISGKKRKKKEKESLRELDSETLYNIINGPDEP